MDEDTDLWRKRFEAVARAQSWYLYVLLVVGIFYLALDSQVHSSFEEQRRPVTLPVVGIPVDPTVVWATGPLVLGLLSLAALGTFPALRFAYRKIECGQGDEAWEARDTAPTAIDFVVYSRDNRLVSALGLLSYPAFLTVVLVEAIALWLGLFALRSNVSHGCLLLVLGALVTVLVMVRVVSLWRYKFRRAWRKWRDWGNAPTAAAQEKDKDFGNRR
jgi:hypothetical protein